jgi:hypothetical protein
MRSQNSSKRITTNYTGIVSKREVMKSKNNSRGVMSEASEPTHFTSHTLLDKNLPGPSKPRQLNDTNMVNDAK